MNHTLSKSAKGESQWQELPHKGEYVYQRDFVVDELDKEVTGFTPHGINPLSGIISEFSLIF